MKTIKRLTIPQVIKAINESNNPMEIMRYENQMACMLASPVMLLAALAYGVVALFMNQENPSEAVLNTTIFLCLFASFEILLRARLKQDFVSISLVALYPLLFVTIMVRMFAVFGPAMWMIACIQLIYAMSRIKKTMVITVSLVTLLACIYSLANPSQYAFEMSYYHLIPQALLVLYMILVTSIVHKINSDRYANLISQYQLVVQQKNNIINLYDEISATEEELRQQNLQLVAYNEEIKRGENQLFRLAYTDPLTELPNRKMFMEYLEKLILESKIRTSVFYVVFIDVDSFKKINDSMGHHVGDMYIKLIADRLRTLTSPEDMVGRLGGDEFALIVSRKFNREVLLQNVEEVRKGLAEPCRIENAEIRSTASFGISVFPNDGETATELLKNADLSMYKAKESGKNTIRFFEKYMHDEIVRKVEMESKLIHALKNEEFYLMFQPQYYVDTGKLRGFEALVRWKSPELGIVNPKEFIPLTEEMGLIVPLGKWLMKAACQKFTRLMTLYPMDVTLSINISTIQIIDSSFADFVRNTLHVTGLNPQRLEFEITESVFMESIDKAVLLLKALKKIGLKVALDDFGTGYSSLSYLKKLPIDTLKIDKSFIDFLSEDMQKHQIIGDIISLGHNLGATVMAEGVEQEYQLNYIRAHGCDYVQGFLLSAPIDEQALEDLLQSQVMVAASI